MPSISQPYQLSLSSWVGTTDERFIASSRHSENLKTVCLNWRELWSSQSWKGFSKIYFVSITMYLRSYVGSPYIILNIQYLITLNNITITASRSLKIFRWSHLISKLKISWNVLCIWGKAFSIPAISSLQQKKKTGGQTDKEGILPTKTFSPIKWIKIKWLDYIVINYFAYCC